jgi:cytochrome c biogenesis protein CcmG, thiol:disulfide interchange protein DsbE
MNLFLYLVARGASRLSVVTSLLLAWAASAEQVKLNSLAAFGGVFSNVTILTFNTTHVCFSHEGGISSLKLRYLEPKLQARFGYDPAAAEEAEKRQTADDARYQESVVSNIVALAQQTALAAQRAAATSEDSLADPVSKTSLIGKQAPAIKGEKWLGEKPELEGKAVLVAFWAPWSIPCRKYIPQLEGLQKKFAGKLAVVGVTSESEAEIAGMSESQPQFGSLLDAKAQLAATIGVTSIPYIMLADAKGVVRYQGHPSAVNEKQLEHFLAKAEK